MDHMLVSNISNQMSTEHSRVKLRKKFLYFVRVGKKPDPGKIFWKYFKTIIQLELLKKNKLDWEMNLYWGKPRYFDWFNMDLIWITPTDFRIYFQNILAGSVFFKWMFKNVYYNYKSKVI